MTKYPQISVSQVVILLIVSRLSSLFAYKPLTYSLSLFDTVLGIAIASIINVLIFLPFILIKKDVKTFDNSKIFNKILFAIIFSVSVFICVENLTQFDFFMSSTIYLGVKPIVFILPMLAIAVYICSKGIETIARISGIIFIGLLVSVVSISFSLLNSVDFSLTDMSFLNQKNELVNYVINNVSHTTEILPLIIIIKNTKGNLKRGVAWFGLITGIIFEIILFFTSSVLGEYRKEIIFPFYTLSAMAKNSVTDRFSAMFIILLIFVSAIRLCLYLYTAGVCLNSIFNKISSVTCFIMSSIIIFIATMITTTNVLYLDGMHRILSSGMVLIIALTISIIIKIISKKNERENI